MDLRWEHHLLSVWHPGIWIAVAVASVLAWLIGAATVKLMLRVRDPWRRVVYLSLPVFVVAVLEFFLPYFLFFVGWRLTHPSYVYADLFMARNILILPFVIGVVSAIRQIIARRHERHAVPPAAV
jgi:hypothetical protein